MTNSESESKLTMLIAKKEALFERLNRIFNLSKNTSIFESRKNEKFLAESETISDLSPKFESIIDQINDLQFKLYQKSPDFTALSAFEDLYSSIMYTRKNLVSSTNTQSPSEKPRIKLPPLDIPIFDGSYKSWPIFYEMFKNNVHLNTELNDTQRVQYLISKLSHNALKATAGLIPTGETYQVIWNGLVKKYQDTRGLGVHYLNNILDIKNCVGNAVSLNAYIEQFAASVTALKQLDIPDLADFIILHCALRKVDMQTLQSFESSVSSGKIPSCSEFTSFIQDHVKVLERSRGNKSQVEPRATDTASAAKRNPPIRTYKTFVSSNEPQKVPNHSNVIQGHCPLCIDHTHKLFECFKFKNMTSPQVRYQLVKSNNGCINCLSFMHQTSRCKSQSRCKVCNKKHHSFLHFDNKPISNQPSRSAFPVTAQASEISAPSPLATVKHLGVALQSTAADNNNNNNSASLSLTAVESKPNSTILLSTAQVYALRQDNADKVVIRCLIDNGSQNNLITLDCCKRLNLHIVKLHHSFLQGVGKTSRPIYGYVYFDIESRFNPSHRYYIHALVVDCITDRLPSSYINVSEDVSYLNGLPLADLTWNLPGDIELVIGVQLFPYIYLGDKVGSGKHTPLAVSTTFGYVLMGDVACHFDPPGESSFSAFTNSDIESNLQKFFELEEVPSQRFISPDELECENIFDTSVLFKENRYFVDLPFSRNPSELGNSRAVALRRFLALERKFNQVPNLRERYNDTIAEYLREGYLSEVPDSELTDPGYYIPHHAVVRPDKDSIRIVLDASSKTHSGLSLNDILHVGPNLQADLFLLLLDFRTFPVAMTADIKQMFLRIGVNEHHRKYLRILFRFDKNESVRTFNFNRVPFGLKPSPYLAMRTLRCLSDAQSDRFPEASKMIETQFYMDDFVHSVPDEQTAIVLSQELINLFKIASFDLVKWASNSPALLEVLPESHRLPVSFSGMHDINFKILGLSWEPADDAFSLTTVAIDERCTKRTILSLVARLFDVLGLVAPVLLYAKILIKELWLAKIDWDEVPPESILSRFSAFTHDFPALSSLRIPRHIGVFKECEVNIVAFCDASFSGYGCCIYLHITDAEHNITARLLCAKSKVSPAKITTLARLELVAAVLLSKLVRSVQDKLAARVPIAGIYAFSDSTIALSWIHSSPHRWSVFVSNRIARIHENLASSCFHHIAGKENPSDCLSRGMLPSQLITHSLWWDGPRWLNQPINTWPLSFTPADCDTLPELIKSKSFLSASNTEPFILNDLFDRVCSWGRLLRIVVYILRFLKKLPASETVQNIDVAEKFIVRHTQIIHFSNEINLLKAGQNPSKKLLRLSVFMDDDDILRIGGRLSKSDLPYEAKHPALLPKHDRVVDLIIDYYHSMYCHTGPGLLMSIIRQRFWVLDARTVIRARCRKCNTCFRLNPTHPTPKMADLPEFRVRDAKAFVHTGVDFAGPLNYIPTRRRGQHSQKVYICLFICLVTKAIHLELVSDLTSESFLSAFKRFISRRGPVSVIYSDNGTNFVGAKAQLNEMYTLLLTSDFQSNIRQELLKNRIEWRLIPPRAPHFGGMWESNIKSVKTHLFRVVGKQLLTYEELLTVLVQIEGILNSRPLCVLSADPHPDILTPAHFLMSTPLKYLPSSELTDERASLTSRKKLLDQLVNSYWKKWRVEYLHTLQVRQKWCTSDCAINVGTVVLMGQDDSPPLHWPLGVITEVFPGSDDIVRVALVKTASGTYKRPVTKLYPLPTQ